MQNIEENNTPRENGDIIKTTPMNEKNNEKTISLLLLIFL